MSDYQNYENSLLILDKIFGTTKNVPSYPTYLPENKESLYTSLYTSGLTQIKSCNCLKTDSSWLFSEEGPKEDSFYSNPYYCLKRNLY